MSRFRNFAVGACLTLAGAAIPAAALASNLDFKLDNEAGQDVTALYLTPHSDSDWGDAIENGATGAGNTNDITFDNDADGNNCYYDVRVKFADGSKASVYNVDLCSAISIELDTNNKGDVLYDVVYIAGNN